MKTYLVTWQVELEADIEAKTPEEAARGVFNAHRKMDYLDSLGTVFKVQQKLDDGYGKEVRIEIEAEEEKT